MDPSADRAINAVIERQMRNWEFMRSARAKKQPQHGVKPFVTVSRAAGSGGEKVVTLVSEASGWPVFDREVLQHMAGDDAVRQRIYESLDERDVGFIQESLRTFFVGDLDRNDYFRRLSETILGLARQGNSIFVGRGADLMLPRDTGLRVRMTALAAVCAVRYAQAQGISAVQAAREIEQLSHERQRWVRTHFQVDPTSPDRFDLIINMASVSAEDSAEMILTCLRRRGWIT